MNKGVLCEICPKTCVIPEGHKGFCGARTNREGKIVAANYGKITSMALDPIEKKPLKRFHPGSRILSVGSYGCNLRCPFCQNYEISMGNDSTVYLELTPEELISRALEQIPRGNIGVAYTYNEPLIGYEFVRDCAYLAAKKGLKNVVVTNGYINEKPFSEILPLIDAFNIDLKSFSPEFYRSVGGNLETVKTSIKLAAKQRHVEVTTLVIAGDNDSEEEMRALSSWLASVNPEIPLHISRFFPAFKMSNRLPTPIKTILDLVEIAQESLRYVYSGNI
jgi:pyruvate formate lyase activating enzyme